MKKYYKIVSFALLLLVFSKNSHSQERLLDTVYRSFVNDYADNLEQGNDFLNSLRITSGKIFSRSNLVFGRLFQSELVNNDSSKSFQLLFDSVISRFLKKDIWIDSPFNFAEQTNIMEKPLLAFCECLTPTYKLMLIKQDKSLVENGPGDSCFQKLTSDEALLKKLQQFASTAPPGKQINVGLFLERFMFLNCPAVRNFELLVRRSVVEMNFMRSQ
jgi:hypothetical protein